MQEKIIMMKPSELKPYGNNPRKNDKAVDMVAQSIKDFGFKNPIIVDKNNVIIAGHTRLLASQKLGLKEVPVIVADDLTEEQANALRLVDNRTAEASEWDFDRLKEELEKIDMDLSAFDFGDLTKEEETAIDDLEEGDVPEIDEEKEPITQRGDLWQLGEHRLLCGDSTISTDIDKLMNGEKADLLLTDPPYNVDYSEKVKSLGKKSGRNDTPIENDAMSSEDFITFLQSALFNATDALKAGGSYYIWYANIKSYEVFTALKNLDLKVRQNLVWVKNNFVIGRNDYQWKHEPCLYGWKDGAPHYFSDSRAETSVIDDEPNINRMSREQLRAYIKELRERETPTTVLREDKPQASHEHPTMKPVKLMARLIRNSTKPTEKVLDIFGGSGSTLIACEQMNRVCYMNELEPKYCDLIISRWEKLTGRKAVLIKDE